MIKKIPLFILLTLFCSAVSAQDQAITLLEKMTNAIRTLNFTTSFVVVKNNQAEPYHWFHGVTNNGDELELLSQLNGPRRDLIRKNSTVSYLEPEFPEPYSVNSRFISGPIPDVFLDDITKLLDDYEIILLGRARILGHAAQGIRIVPKDNFRFGYHLWLEKDSNLLLKLVVVNKQNQMLEQIQFTHLDIIEELPAVLKQIIQLELPKPMAIDELLAANDFSWNVLWLPKGFKEINASKHRLLRSEKSVEYRMFSDGLVDVSVYVNDSEVNNRKAQFTNDGATLAFNQISKNIEVSIVGDIPIKTAKAIADSIQLTKAK